MLPFPPPCIISILGNGPAATSAPVPMAVAVPFFVAEAGGPTATSARVMAVAGAVPSVVPILTLGIDVTANEEDMDVRTSMRDDTTGWKKHPAFPAPFPACAASVSFCGSFGVVDGLPGGSTVAFIDYHSHTRDDDRWCRGIGQTLEALEAYRPAVRAAVVALPPPSSKEPLGALTHVGADMLSLYRAGVAWERLTLATVCVVDPSLVATLRQAAASSSRVRLEFNCPAQQAEISPVLARRPAAARQRLGRITTPSEFSRITQEELGLLTEMNAILACQHHGVVPYRNNKPDPEFVSVVCIKCGANLLCREGPKRLFRSSVGDHVRSCKSAAVETAAEGDVVNASGVGTRDLPVYVKDIVEKAKTYTGPGYKRCAAPTDPEVPPVVG